MIRWRHETRGDVLPEAFIPLAEETGLIIPIGDWVLRQACSQATEWPAPLRVAVNVSPIQFREAAFVERVQQALLASGLEPGRLELEVTEGILLTDTDETLVTLGRLRALGVSLAMDDFGTGYSSLGYLLKFRFDKIKIDRSFVHELAKGEDAAAIVSAVLALCHSLGIRSNAEGVEAAHEEALLRDQGCQEIQGYHTGRPMPAEQIGAYFVTHSLVLSDGCCSAAPGQLLRDDGLVALGPGRRSAGGALNETAARYGHDYSRGRWCSGFAWSMATKPPSSNRSGIYGPCLWQVAILPIAIERFAGRR
ncbi:EAL domain-containing protein [Roseomonas hellenica]|uniref:EAL domain-containing protein n=1 Tax=Plastoroseomonas hellenica TaxID=2687306 RepID=A0ABS5F3S8_9PROT|nr:EAL domain-containing protein [Plastoroseomonas hellenica]MBR0667192.1 EAL domain-containing protein [Plastoroseomonas hellenica]